MSTADQLLELMFSWIEQRERCAEPLRKLAQELESLRGKCNTSECVGSSVVVFGAACVIGAGVATVLTAGAAAPVLGLLGAVSSGVGVTISVVTKITEHFLSSDAMKEAQKIEKKNNEITEKIQKLFQQLKTERKEVSSFTDSDDQDRHVMTEILRAMGRRSGLKGQVSVHMVDQFFLGAGPKDKRLNQILNPTATTGVAVGLAGILAFFTFQVSGKRFKRLFAKGAEQLIKQISTAGFKTALKGGAMVVGAAVGLAFALPEAIEIWKDQIKKNHVTEASQSLRDTADAILKISETLRKQFSGIGRMFEKLAEVKRCIENSNRSSEEKETLIDFAIKMCEDEAVRRWLREDSDTEDSESKSRHQAFFKLVDMFDKVKKMIGRDSEENIDIVFVAHGRIEEPMIPASTLLPLSTIKDVVLYSPWNCAINAGVAYGVATGEMQPQHRRFICRPKTDSQIPDSLHQPTNLPNYWNSMKTAGGQEIPNIIVSPLGSEDGVWKCFKNLEKVFGQPGRNRIVIPFILLGEIEVPFFVITLALSLVLFFSGFRATVHVAACLSKRGRTLCEDDLEKQYACTIDNTLMIPSKEMFFILRYPVLYRALKAVFG